MKPKVTTVAINRQIVKRPNQLNQFKNTTHQYNNIHTVKPNKLIEQPVQVKQTPILTEQLIKPKQLIPQNTQKTTSKDPQTTKIISIQNSCTGRCLVILGNGPSLLQTDTSTLNSLPNVSLCTINVPDERCWPTPYWAFYDRIVLQNHKDLYYSYSGTIFNTTTINELNQNSIKFRHIPGVGFSHDLVQGLCVGMSSVYATIQVGLYMGFDKIFILGCDMNPTVDKNRTHFYGKNKTVDTNDRLTRFEKECNWYDFMAEILPKDIRNRIIFCSKGINPWPFLNHFESITPEESFSAILGYSSGC